MNVALATYGVPSNNNLNVIEEMHFSSYCQKVTNSDATVGTPEYALYCATRGGAIAMGRHSGFIKEGYDADICVLDFDQPHLWPSHNKLNDLVFSATAADVCLSMCNGEVLYKDGEYKTLDIEKVKAEMKSSTNRIIYELANA
ncbi:MAG: amidohydrolase family protein [Eggerthellaceae bacterium]|nr:amidohydrolase family protein [Eggerthellaceae bacterium]